MRPNQFTVYTFVVYVESIALSQSMSVGNSQIRQIDIHFGSSDKDAEKGYERPAAGEFLAIYRILSFEKLAVIWWEFESGRERHFYLYSS